jgi:hypothetical protein
MGGICIDSSTGVAAWKKNPAGNTWLIAHTFREAAKAAPDHGEFLVAEGEICWGVCNRGARTLTFLKKSACPVPSAMP